MSVAAGLWWVGWSASRYVPGTTGGACIGFLTVERGTGAMNLARARNAASRVSRLFTYNIVNLIKPSSIWPSANRSRASCSNRLRCLCR